MRDELGAGEVGSDICDVRWKLAPKVKGGYTATAMTPRRRSGSFSALDGARPLTF